MKEEVVERITRANGRKALFHFTRASNLPFMAHSDSLWASFRIDPEQTGERRIRKQLISRDGHSITINAHLKIPDAMIDATTTQVQFRECLDRHVFLWPTLSDCRKMVDIYARREPDESFAVLEFDAKELLMANYHAVKLSKYDSGSSPRFPNLCSYRKSPEMFQSLDDFQIRTNATVPTKPSEIREMLIEDRMVHISRYLKAVYADTSAAIPEAWRGLVKPLTELKPEQPVV